MTATTPARSPGECAGPQGQPNATDSVSAPLDSVTHTEVAMAAARQHEEFADYVAAVSTRAVPGCLPVVQHRTHRVIDGATLIDVLGNPVSAWVRTSPTTLRLSVSARRHRPQLSRAVRSSSPTCRRGPRPC